MARDKDRADVSFRIQLEDCSQEEAERVPLNAPDPPVSSGGSLPTTPRKPRPLKVEFIGMDNLDIEKNDSGTRKAVENDLKRVNRKGAGAQSVRYHQPRMSLLGKPLNYRAHKRDARYRRTQAKIYNFLERPKDWRAISYHLLVFLMVFLCLLLSIFSTVEQYETVSGVLLYYLELFMVVWFMLEFIIRVWGAGCRSRYQQVTGRLQFIRRPLCIVDLIVITASVIILCLGSSGQVFATSALRGLRFFQILRMVRVDRRGGSWKLLGSVVWAHRQELFTTLYIGFLGLIFSSFLVYLAEKEKNPKLFGTYADALWWGVITLCTVGYGDTVPITWAGKLVAAFCAILGISFFALPAGILGSGFALKVQQQQRQKHLIRRRVPAATLIQCLWRCYAADENSLSIATWKVHTRPCRSPASAVQRTRSTRTPPWYKMKEVFKWSFNQSSDDEDPSDKDAEDEPTKFKHNSSFMSRLSTRRRDRSHQSSQSGTSPMAPRHSILRRTTSNQTPDEKEIDSNDTLNRSHLSLDAGSMPSLRRSEYKESEDDNEESEGVTQLTEQHKKAIRSLRKIKYFVARRKFKEAFRPYDVKDVIEQYSAGHIDMLARIKNFQCRLDLILGKAGSKKPDVYDSKISLASRIVKVERQVEDIEAKLELLIDMYKEDRRWQIQAQQHFLENQKVQPPGPGGAGDGTPQALYPGLRLRSILVDNKQASEPTTPIFKNPNKPMHRNLSDLGPRIKKRVTYRCGSVCSDSDFTPSPPPGSVKRTFMEPSEPDISEVTSLGKQELEESSSPSTDISCKQSEQDNHEHNILEICDGDQMEEDESDPDAKTLSSPPSVFLRNETTPRTTVDKNLLSEAKRTYRIPSCNSTESECVSDVEDNSTLDDTSSASDALLPQNSSDFDPDSVEMDTQVYHMKPESKALLMRPEVLKLRKTSC